MNDPTPDPDDPGAARPRLPAAPAAPEDVRGMLAGVIDPELHASIVDLGMVDDVAGRARRAGHREGRADHRRVPAAGPDQTGGESKVRGLPGVADVKVDYGVCLLSPTQVLIKAHKMPGMLIVFVAGLLAFGCSFLPKAYEFHDPLTPTEHLALGVSYESKAKPAWPSLSTRKSLRAMPATTV